MMPQPPVFTHATIDRHGLRRRDAAWLTALPDEAVRVLALCDGLIAVDGGDDDLRLAPVARDEATTIFLGMSERVAWFAAAFVAPPTGLRFEDLRKVAALLPADEAGMAAYALGLVRWHERNGFCGVCGTATLVVEAGHKRLCPNPACAAEHFPRTDPAIIVLVTQGDACLLGRNARHRPGMHSTLAGFVEPGESLEAAVAREVMEEAAVALADISYHSSQPWPFPASLMLGFTARALTRDFTVDGEEIVEAGWFTRTQLAPYIAGGGDESFSLPGKLSISRRLIEDWYHTGPNS